MEPLLKRYFPQMQKVHQRLVITLLLAVIGLMSAFGIHLFAKEQAIAKEPTTPQLICSSTPTLSPEQLSIQGRASYDQGQFATAIDCWQKASTAFSQSGNETESINNRINQAQAEQALGLLPRACSTLIRIYGEEDCTTLLQDEQKRNQFREKLQEKVNSPAKIVALRSFGNVLRGLGELNLSHEVLLLTLDMTQPREQAAIWLDVGNTRRALSNKEQDLYNRSQERENIICAIIDAYAATDAYRNASTLDLQSPINIQAQLNQVSFLLDLKDWHSKINQQTKGKNDVLDRLFRKSSLVLLNEEKNCWNQLTNPKLDQPRNFQFQFTGEIRDWFYQQLSNKNPLIQSQQIENLQQQIEQLPPSHTALYIRINFAQSLARLDLSNQSQKIAAFFDTTIKQAQKQSDLRAESYALGYLGKLYEKTQQWDLAKTKTQRALLLAQSIPAPEIMYQWQWQLGRIYKPESITRAQAKAKSIQNNLEDLGEARKAYNGAFETLESLRRELASGSSDAQFSFLEEIDGIYREYVDLLLLDEEPTIEHLSQAREVLASLQAVELENFLRQACPEYNVEQIDEIIDKQANTPDDKAAFLYPVLLDDRVEAIVKLPTNPTQKDPTKGLKHYRTRIDRATVEEKIRKLQVDLEEEYTFDDVRHEAREMYGWLIEGAEKYLSKDIDTLVFALDTTLRNIPLAALVYDDTSESPQYLVDKYAIALAPRLDIPTPQIIQNQKLKVLAVGLTEPELKEPQQQTEAELKEPQQLFSPRQFPKLRYVKRELDAIREVGSFNVSVSQLLDKEFKVEEFKDKINSSIFEVLHLATHGEFSSSPERTFILASDEPIKVNEVDNVFRKQAQNQPEPIELLVLSACETAAGDQRATLGISGVAVRAGARSAIASLWTLDDEISVEFTRELYKQLTKLTNQTRQTKAKALQEAQKALKASHGREHPRYWAPYILLGNWL
ncbi:CHAT domain-containing protein [Mastigocladopsis repens]|uniref:CHAT domain-containing protein n=1 Tax=Mastigocladopsis repens TaxID=221287 RepID=UPI0003758454|nr:CHAT domain-containing protein [Mastigocladopsis repens]